MSAAKIHKSTSICQGQVEFVPDLPQLACTWLLASGKLPLLGFGKHDLHHHAVLSRNATLACGHSRHSGRNDHTTATFTQHSQL